jgi:hypothetical protein
VEIGYITPETIKFMIGKAGLQAKALNSLIKEDVQQNKPQEEK